MTEKAPKTVATRQPRIKGSTDLPAPWDPAEHSVNELHAIHAMVEGKATADQQGLVVQWLKRATGIGEMEFRPESDRHSAFAAGKRFVGLQFFSLAKSRLPIK